MSDRLFFALTVVIVFAFMSMAYCAIVDDAAIRDGIDLHNGFEYPPVTGGK